MTAIEELQQISAAWPTSRGGFYTMVHHPALRVGKRLFAFVGGPDDSEISVNLGPSQQRELLDDPRFRRTRYLGQHGWVTVARADLSDPDELRGLLVASYLRVAGRKRCAALGFEAPSKL